jgi:hypothetical protein
MAFPLLLIFAIHPLFVGSPQAFHRAQLRVLAPPRELGF